MTVAWTQLPAEAGWWFHTDELKNWDLAKPFPVWRYEEGDHKVRFVVRVAPETERAVADVGGWWYGPFRVVRPDVVVEIPAVNLAPSWTEVMIVAAAGSAFGVVTDEDGTLTIIAKAPGEKDWPHGIKPATGQNEIAPGYTRYIVTADKHA